MELTTTISALQVRGTNIRDGNAAIVPIGKLAKAVGVKTPKEISDGPGSDEEKAALRGLWKTFQKEYNAAREQAHKQNDAAAAVAGKEFAAKGFRLVRNKAGDVIGANVQYRKPDAKSASEMLSEARKEAAALRAELAALKASKSDVQ